MGSEGTSREGRGVRMGDYVIVKSVRMCDTL